jgi:hypothetical protein
MKARCVCWSLCLLPAVASVLLAPGCYNTPVDVSDVSRGPAPLRQPGPAAADCCYEDGLTGGRIFKLYCASCHDARYLAERPFAHYQNVAQHMRVVVNLTGAEYAKLLGWLKRWHDVPNPDQREVPSPKRFIFSQPIPELRNQKAAPAPGPAAGPQGGVGDEASPGQPPPGRSPLEAR